MLFPGVDETLVVTLKYSNNRMAVFTSSSGLQLHNDAIVVGTKGLIRVGYNDCTCANSHATAFLFSINVSQVTQSHTCHHSERLVFSFFLFLFLNILI